jgi:hypothetical protein
MTVLTVTRCDWGAEGPARVDEVELWKSEVAIHNSLLLEIQPEIRLS